MLKYFIALLLLSLLFYLVDFSALLSAFTYITPGLIVLLLLVSVLMIYISCLKWNLFFASAGKKENVFKLFSLYVMSYFVNLLLPSFIGGDIARSWYAKEKGERQSSFAATLMERLTGFIAMAGLATIALFFLADARIEFITVVAISIVALLFISWVLVSKKLLNFLSGFKFFNKTATKLIPLQDLIRKFFTDWQLLVKSICYSLLFYLVAVLNTIAAAHAVGWYDIPLTELIVVLPLILLVSAIPIAPNGLGLQEGAFYYFLTMIGASPEEALGVGLVIRAKSYLLAAFGGLVLLRTKARFKISS